MKKETTEGSTPRHGRRNFVRRGAAGRHGRLLKYGPRTSWGRRRGRTGHTGSDDSNLFEETGSSARTVSWSILRRQTDRGRSSGHLSRPRVFASRRTRGTCPRPARREPRLRPRLPADRQRRQRRREGRHPGEMEKLTAGSRPDAASDVDATRITGVGRCWEKSRGLRGALPPPHCGRQRQPPALRR